jgi:hypothetical protein
MHYHLDSDQIDFMYLTGTLSSASSVTLFPEMISLGYMHQLSFNLTSILEDLERETIWAQTKPSIYKRHVCPRHQFLAVAQPDQNRLQVYFNAYAPYFAPQISPDSR